jgi:hypothetical protein
MTKELGRLKIYQMIADSNPDNLGDDTFGCRYSDIRT